MKRSDFGELIASLRREHEDEEGNRWSQETLAREANLALGAELFSQRTISYIEQGRRHLDDEMLLALATALQLTSGERREFLLAASGVDTKDMVRADNGPEEILSQLTSRMRQARLPAHIIDSYFDVIAVNVAFVRLYGFGTFSYSPSNVHSQLNKLRFVFSEEGRAHYTQIMGDEWSDNAYQTMMMFRMVSLQYRSTEYFQALLRDLKKLRQFRRYWQEVYLNEQDYFVENKQMHMNSPEWGAVAYFPTYLTALTAAGELNLCIYVPASRHTTEVFARLFDQEDASDVLHLSSWPEKPVLP
jgi:transcriptional regulator with XRE-family HTH domain